MSEEALLDWLCLHVDATDLPKRFVGESVSRKAAAGIKVMAKADEQRAPQRRFSFHPVPTLDMLKDELQLFSAAGIRMQSCICLAAAQVGTFLSSPHSSYI